MTKLLTFSLAAVLAGAGFVAEAAPRDDYRRGSEYDRGYTSGYDDHGRDRGHRGRDRDRDRDHRRGHRRDDRYSYRPDYRPPRHFRVHPSYGYHVYPAPARYVRPPSYRSHRWSHGHHLPRHYYAPAYYVDYRPYWLAPPPRGHRWVRVDNDVLLIALATGLIVDSVYGLFY